VPTDTPLDPSTAARALVRRSWELTTDRAARTAPLRAAMEQRFVDEADGDPEVAAQLRKAYFMRLHALALAGRRRAAAARAAETAKAVGE